MGNANIIKQLVVAGAKIEVEDRGWRPLHSVTHAERGNLEGLKELIARGAKLDAKIHDEYVTGWTPFHIAASAGRIIFAKELLAAGAKLDAKDALGGRPLHVAARYGQANLSNDSYSRG